MTVIPDDFLELPIEELKRFAAIGKKTVENLRELDFETIGDLYDKFTNDHDYFDSEVYTDRIHHRHVLEDLLQEYQDSHVPAGGSDNENEQDSASDDDDAPDDENASDDDNDLADQLTDIRV